MNAKDYCHMVDSDRLSRIFCDLVQIDSPSRNEKSVVEYLRELFAREFGAQVFVDDTAEKTGSNTGNLIIKLDGGLKKAPVFFNAHLDTVEPGTGINVLFQDGCFMSDGSTVLGGDDKAAIAILIESLQILKENNIPFGPVELVFTVCEEIGLLGAKALDTSVLDAKAGYALDSTDPDVVIHQAPAAIRFQGKIIGKAAHAGLNPEDGINAIQLAAQAISRLKLGRIDKETTCNIGLIRGGQATNIVPELVVIDGEVRSHDKDMLRRVQDDILGTLYKTVSDARDQDSLSSSVNLPRVEIEVYDDYPLMSVPSDEVVVKSVMEAGQRQGRQLRLERTGGGSDASIFNGKGIKTLILGIGMQQVHTTEEFIRLEDMIKTVSLVLGIIELWPAG